MGVQYRREVDFDPALIDLEANSSTLYTQGTKSTAGAPNAALHANKFIPGAIMQVNDGNVYQNTGTTPLPVWTLIAAGGGGGITSINGNGLAAQLITGGVGITVSNPIAGTTQVDSDGLTAVSAADTTPDYLQPKINVRSSDLSITVVESITNPGANEVLDIDLVVAGGGAGAPNYAEFYGLTPGTGNGGADDYAATIAVHTAAGTGRVPFPRSGANSGAMTIAIGATAPALVAEIDIPAVGVYHVIATIHTTEPGQFQLELQGAALPYTTSANMNPTAGGHTHTIDALITTVVINSKLAVINPAGNSTALTITPADGASTNANAQTITIQQIDLAGSGGSTLPSGDIFVGSAGNAATAVTMSGDATIDNAGVVTVASSSSVNFEVAGGVVNAGATLAAGFYPTVAASSALSGPGAIPTTSYQTRYTSTGIGDALTLIDGTKIGQLKKVSYIAESAGADTVIITPANLAGFTTATLFAIGDYIVFMWNGADWLPVDYIGAVLA